MQGTAQISLSVPNVDEGNLKGQILDITVQSLSETVKILKDCRRGPAVGFEEPKQQKIAAIPEISHQLYEQTNKEKKMRI